jgi:hypothetical protein
MFEGGENDGRIRPQFFARKPSKKDQNRTIASKQLDYQQKLSSHTSPATGY